MGKSTKKKTRAPKRGKGRPRNVSGQPWGSEEVRKEMVRRLIDLAKHWEMYFQHLFIYQHSHIEGSQPERTSAVAHVLKATWIAFVQNDDKTLKRLSDLAKKILKEQADRQDKETGQLMIDISAYAPPGFELWKEPLGFIVPIKGKSGWGSRERAIEALLNTMWMYLKDKRFRSMDDCVDAVLCNAMIPHGLGAILADHDIRIAPNEYHDYIQRVSVEFEKSNTCDAEELLIAALRIFGLSKDNAHKLARSGDPKSREGQADKAREAREQRKGKQADHG